MMITSNVLIGNLCFLLTLFLSHQSLSSCYRVTTRLNKCCRDIPSPRPQVCHHFILIFSTIMWDVLTNSQPFLIGGGGTP